MDIEKLKKIAVMAVHGTKNERAVACKILKNHGYDDPSALLKQPVSSEHGFCPGIRINVDEITDEMIQDIERALKKRFIDMASRVDDVLDQFIGNISKLKF